MANRSQRRSVWPAKATPPTAKLSASKVSKLDQIIRAMRAPKGATLATLMRITNWQKHSVRGAIAGALKKKRALTVTSEKIGTERVYRLSGKS